MSGATWNPKKKTPEQEWEELVIKKDEFYDVLTTEECLDITKDEEVCEQGAQTVLKTVPPQG